MEDDWRAIDWPKNQVERLDKEIGELADTSVQTRREVAISVQEINHRLRKIERRLRKGDDDEAEPIEKWTDRQLEKMGSSLRGMERRLDEFESRVSLVEANQAFGHRQTDGAIDRIARRVGNLVEMVEAHGDRLASIETDEPCVTPELLRRISTLEADQDTVGYREWKRLTDRVSNLEAESATRSGLNLVLDRLDKIDAALTAYGIPLGGPQPMAMSGPTVTEDKIPQFGAPWTEEPEPEFSQPVGGRLIDFTRSPVEAEKARITGAAAIRQEAYERGSSVGYDTGLAEAERRAVLYMERHFSDATIRALRKAIRGENSGS